MLKAQSRSLVLLALLSLLGLREVSAQQAPGAADIGTYSEDCANPRATKAAIDADSLSLTIGNNTFRSRNVELAHSWFGNTPPRGFLYAANGSVLSGRAMVFEVYEDKTGRYLKIASAPDAAERALGRKLPDKTILRQCVAKAATSPDATEPAHGNGAVKFGSAAELAKNPIFKTVFAKALGPVKSKERWIVELPMGLGAPEKVEIGGNAYIYAASCKPNDCGNYRVWLFYSPTRKLVAALLNEKGQFSQYGDRDTALGAELTQRARADLNRQKQR
jgi:Inhibitor of vertebrate lysozyme (Ivy)